MPLQKLAKEIRPPQPPAKQILYPDVVFDVQVAPEGHVMLVIVAPGEALCFPMSVEYAKKLGHRLTAPHIVGVN